MKTIVARIRELFIEKYPMSLEQRMAIPDDMTPITQTSDGWYYADGLGNVIHASVDNEEHITDVKLTTMLIGRLSRDIPLATAIVPQTRRRIVCDSCDGTGVVPNLPTHLVGHVVCSCGGLGWKPQE